MTIIQPYYFHREYSRDISLLPNQDRSPLNLSKRVALLALPFISLYNPLAYPLSLGLGVVRSVTTASQLWDSFKNDASQEAQKYYGLQALISTMAIAATLFAHPLGMLITTCDDLRIEMIKINHHLVQDQYQEAFASCLNMINHSLYLTMFLTRNAHIGIASLSMQAIIALYYAHKQFQKDQWLEGSSHLGMALIRGHQLSFQIKQLSPHILPIPYP